MSYPQTNSIFFFVLCAISYHFKLTPFLSLFYVFISHHFRAQIDILPLKCSLCKFISFYIVNFSIFGRLEFFFPPHFYVKLHLIKFYHILFIFYSSNTFWLFSLLLHLNNNSFLSLDSFVAIIITHIKLRLNLIDNFLRE